MAALPWERLANESSPAWEAFVKYRDLGSSRSNAAVGQALGKSKCLMDGWSSKHNWVNRCAAFDAEMDRQALAAFRKAREAAIKEMVERHAKQARALQYKALDRLANMKPEELRPGATADDGNKPMVPGHDAHGGLTLGSVKKCGEFATILDGGGAKNQAGGYDVPKLEGE